MSVFAYSDPCGFCAKVLETHSKGERADTQTPMKKLRNYEHFDNAISSFIHVLLWKITRVLLTITYVYHSPVEYMLVK